MKGAMTKKIEIFKRSLPVRLHKSSGRVVNSAGRKRKTLQLIIRESEVILRHAFPFKEKEKSSQLIRFSQVICIHTILVK